MRGLRRRRGVTSSTISVVEYERARSVASPTVRDVERAWAAAGVGVQLHSMKAGRVRVVHWATKLDGALERSCAVGGGYSLALDVQVETVHIGHRAVPVLHPFQVSTLFFDRRTARSSFPVPPSSPLPLPPRPLPPFFRAHFGQARSTSAGCDRGVCAPPLILSSRLPPPLLLPPPPLSCLLPSAFPYPRGSRVTLHRSPNGATTDDTPCAPSMEARSSSLRGPSRSRGQCRCTAAGTDRRRRWGPSGRGRYRLVRSPRRGLR